jgi:hypothetical protein
VPNTQVLQEPTSHGVHMRRALSRVQVLGSEAWDDGLDIVPHARHAVQFDPNYPGSPLRLLWVIIADHVRHTSHLLSLSLSLSLFYLFS